MMVAQSFQLFGIVNGEHAGVKYENTAVMVIGWRDTGSYTFPEIKPIMVRLRDRKPGTCKPFYWEPGMDIEYFDTFKQAVATMSAEAGIISPNTTL